MHRLEQPAKPALARHFEPDEPEAPHRRRPASCLLICAVYLFAPASAALPVPVLLPVTIKGDAPRTRTEQTPDTLRSRSPLLPSLNDGSGQYKHKTTQILFC